MMLTGRGLFRHEPVHQPDGIRPDPLGGQVHTRRRAQKGRRRAANRKRESVLSTRAFVSERDTFEKSPASIGSGFAQTFLCGASEVTPSLARREVTATRPLPCRIYRNWWQPTATVLACFCGSLGRRICDRLPLVATTRLHKGSIICRLVRQQSSSEAVAGPRFGPILCLRGGHRQSRLMAPEPVAPNWSPR